jgi:hypothetical protein
VIVLVASESALDLERDLELVVEAGGGTKAHPVSATTS